MIMNILLVSNNEKQRRVLEDLLGSFGYEVNSDYQGFRVLDYLKAKNADLIILDIVNAQIDSLALLREVKSLKPSIEAIMLSDYFTLDQAVKGIKQGVDDFLIKPYTNNEIFLAVARIKEKLYYHSQLEAERSRIQKERDHLTAQLAQMQKMEAIGNLASGLAHDFNNMLAGIIGFSEIARASASRPVKQQINKVIEVAKNASELARHILLIGKKVTTDKMNIDINKFVDRAVGLFRRIIEENIEIKLSLQPDIPCAYAEESQVMQVLMNLVINARDSMPKGGRINIKTGFLHADTEYCSFNQCAMPGNFVFISVSDTGKGIPDDIKDRIFDPFYTTKKAGKGSGMGLAMTDSIIKAHGGWIEFQSASGKGTEFKVYIPSSEVCAESTEIEKMPSAKKRLARGKETILLVDDEEIIRDMGLSILNMLGYSVITASNGEEAVDIYKRKRNDIALIIMDKVMPKMDGILACKAIRRLNKDVKLIVSSAYAEDEKEDMTKKGISGFLAKPYNIVDMSRLLRNVIDN